MEPITVKDLLITLKLARKYVYWKTAETGTASCHRDLADIDIAIERAKSQCENTAREVCSVCGFPECCHKESPNRTRRV